MRMGLNNEKSSDHGLMKQLDVVGSPPAFVWDPHLTLTHVTLDLDICSRDMIFEPTCAHARWALMHRFPSGTRYLTKIHWTIIHISPSIVASTSVASRLKVT